MYQGEKVDVTGRVKHYRKADFGRHDNVMSLGCAEGYDEIWLAGNTEVNHVYGIDVDPVAIQKAKDDAENAYVRNKTLFCCMDANQLLVMRFEPRDQISVLLLMSVARWIGPDKLAGIVRFVRPLVIYCESHSVDDHWTSDLLHGLDELGYEEPEEIGRLPYTIEDPRPIRVMYRIQRFLG